MKKHIKNKILKMYDKNINPKDIAIHTNTNITDVLLTLNISDRNFSDEKALIRRLKRGSFVIMNDGVHKKCPRCNDFYPIHSDFWPKNSKASDQCAFICKACDHERKPHFKKKQAEINKLKRKFEDSLKFFNAIFRSDCI